MKTGYFAPLVNMPIVIGASGKYKTRCGEMVIIKTVSHRHDFGCKGNYENGIGDAWHKSGRLFSSRETANDVIESWSLSDMPDHCTAGQKKGQ